MMGGNPATELYPIRLELLQITEMGGHTYYRPFVAKSRIWFRLLCNLIYPEA